MSKSRTKRHPRSQSPGWREIGYLFAFLLGIWLTLALIDYRPLQGDEWEAIRPGLTGSLGRWVAEQLMTWTFGRWASFIIPMLLFLGVIAKVSRGRIRGAKLGLALVFAGFLWGIGVSLLREGRNLPPDALFSGIFPLLFAQISLQYLSFTGAILFWMALIATYVVIFLRQNPLILLEAIFVKFPSWLSEVLKPDREKLAKPEGFSTAPELSYPPPGYAHTDEKSLQPISHPKRTDTLTPPSSHIKLHRGVDARAEWQFPPLELLNPRPPVRSSVDRAELESNSRRLEEKLLSLGITARVVKTNPGPVITRYDLEPSAEVKLSRIINLADDLAMALRAPGVRILAPIPGESAVGIEIPNRSPEIVYLSEVIAVNDFLNHPSPLAIPLGKDAWGYPFITDLTRMPHLLIAGATGSGKSVFINTILVSLLYRSHPHDLRFLLIDPKKIELSLYGSLSRHHLVVPPGIEETVITEPDNAVAALTSIHKEMERRYEILAHVGVRSLEEYNRWAESKRSNGTEPVLISHLPYIVVIIDEMADLMLTARRNFEELVVRLAQMSRAVGIHLIVATQRPSVDIITGLIKANFPARIAFQMASRADSRTILDGSGAETLLGKGDMLYTGPGSRGLQRLHSALVTTEEVERVVGFISELPSVDDEFNLPPPDWSRVRAGSPKEGTAKNILETTDELFKEAAKIVVNMEQGSVSILQRRLRIGYARAARLIDQLEQAGIVGPFDGSKARQILVTREELRERFGIE